jgi:hypothetical protein
VTGAFSEQKQKHYAEEDHQASTLTLPALYPLLFNPSTAAPDRQRQQRSFSNTTTIVHGDVDDSDEEHPGQQQSAEIDNVHVYTFQQTVALSSLAASSPNAAHDFVAHPDGQNGGSYHDSATRTLPHTLLQAYSTLPHIVSAAVPERSVTLSPTSPIYPISTSTIRPKLSAYMPTGSQHPAAFCATRPPEEPELASSDPHRNKRAPSMKRMRPGYVKRPPNAFILFRSHVCANRYVAFLTWLPRPVCMS